MSLKAWCFVVCFSLNLYLLGVMVVMAAVLYPMLGAHEGPGFGASYQAFTSRIGAPVVAFEFLSLLAVGVLYAARPPAVPVEAVHVLLALGAAYFAITFAWHLPAHRALAAGEHSAQALAPLLRSQWARTGVHAVRVGVLAWLMARSVG